MLLISFFLSLLTSLLGLFTDAETVASKAVVPKSTIDNTIKAERLAWSVNRRLNWEDFKAIPDDANPHHAVTSANLSVDASCKNNELVYEVKCVFLPTESWSKNKKSERLLYHEQLHFDLTEVHARQLRQKLKQLGNTCSNFKNRMNPAIAEAFKLWKDDQVKFDELSNHGLNSEVQQEWANYIEEQLIALEQYKSI